MRSLRHLLFLGLTLLLVAANAQSAEPPSSKPARPSDRPPAMPVPTTSAASFVRNIVYMDELMDMYEPVPFEHRRHAQMADMWDGCETCHHHSPTTAPTTQAVTTARSHAPSQADAAVIPQCKSCHANTVEESTAISMPSLKGAYHRQCLNCHRDWMDANACVVCHAARSATAPTTMVKPSPDDIVGRIHKPIPEPTTREFVTRFTPVAGPNVQFRHEEHAKGFAIRCVTCHRHDACSSCHSAPAATSAPATPALTTSKPATEPAGSRPLKPGRTWRDTHGPCISCHQQEHCAKCHYSDGQQPPAAFDHAKTGQKLDKDHATLACAKCHRNYKDITNMTCGDATCHKRTVALPTDRPGPVIAATRPASQPATQRAQPATRPIIIRIRRGGS